MQSPSEPGLGARPEALNALQALGRTEALQVRVAGDCMAPWLRDGDLVTVRPRRRYWPGDVVVFFAATAPPGEGVPGSERLTMHRVIGWGPGRLTRPWRDWSVWTQADRAARPDRPIAAARILGQVELPGGRTLVAALRAWSRFLTHTVRRLADRLIGTPAKLAPGAPRA